MLYMKVCTYQGRLTTPSFRHWESFICESMYMSTPTDNAICQTLRVFYMWKYVHVDANWQRHLSDTESLLYVKVCSCRPQLTTPSVRHSESFICESMFTSTPTDNAICQTLRVFYMWKYVLVDANWQRHLSDIESLLYVKVCSCRRQLTTPSVRHWESFICESMFMSTPTDNAICQTLEVFYMYMWQYVYVKAVWQLTLSEPESKLICSLCESCITVSVVLAVYVLIACIGA
jgi:hypothetical protein